MHTSDHDGACANRKPRIATLAWGINYGVSAEQVCLPRKLPPEVEEPIFARLRQIKSLLGASHKSINDAAPSVEDVGPPTIRSEDQLNPKGGRRPLSFALALRYVAAFRNLASTQTVEVRRVVELELGLIEFSAIDAALRGMRAIDGAARDHGFGDRCANAKRFLARLPRLSTPDSESL